MGPARGGDFSGHDLEWLLIFAKQWKKVTKTPPLFLHEDSPPPMHWPGEAPNAPIQDSKTSQQIPHNCGCATWRAVLPYFAVSGAVGGFAPAVESGVGLDRCDSLRAWAGSDGSYSVTLGFQGPYYWVLKGSRALTIRSFEALGYGWCPWRVASRLNVN